MTDAPLSSGIALDELDPAVRPHDDLFRHVNGKWIDRTEIPGDKARWGSFHQLAEAAEKNVQQIIFDAQNAAEGTVERKIGDLYTSFMNDEAIERLGIEPLLEHLAQASTVDSVPALLRTIGELQRQGIGGVFQPFVDNDPGNPERYLVFLEQGGITLPDESYFRDEKFEAVRAAYLAHLQTMFELAAEAGAPASDDDAAERAQRVFQLETDIAALHWDNVKTRDSQATYNLRTWDEFASAVAGSAANSSIELDVWRSALLGEHEHAFDEVVVREPSFFEQVGGLFTEDRLPAWRDWLAWKIVHSAAPYLPAAFVEANFDFYARTLTGTPDMRDRWKRAVSLVEGALGEAVGQVYVARHFPPQAKDSMDVLVANLVEAYRQSIESLDWMSEETRLKALDKLSKFTPKIGFPVKWRDYSDLVIDPDDLFGNVRRSNLFDLHRELGKIGQPLDRDEWFMTPQTINAYYNPGFNEIVFPAAILQYPFFDETRDAAANYGAIGAVIGHEIGHGFDDQGSQYDGDGKLENWWTEADRAAFEERTKALIAQYDALVPTEVPDSHVNGALTIGENIGDLGGLSIAWKAYLLSLDGQEPPVVDGLTGAERFFLSWAQAWRMAIRPEEAARLLSIDPHSPNEFRCNQVVRNIDVWYDTFGVTEQDAMYLDPAERVAIW